MKPQNSKVQNNKFKSPDATQVAAKAAQEAVQPVSSRSPFLSIPGVGAGESGVANYATLTGSVLSQLGLPASSILRYAEEPRNSFTEEIRFAAREPLIATALIYAMLLRTDETLRTKQLSELGKRSAPWMKNSHPGRNLWRPFIARAPKWAGLC